MSSILESLSQQLGAGGVSEIARQLGADQRATGNAITAALPVLLGALQRNASDPRGADALTNALRRDHDGSVLDDLTGFIGKAQSGPGAAILGHVLGGRQQAVQQNLGRATGLDAGAIGKLLVTLAPMVMGALGKQQRQANLDAGGIADLLGQERSRLERKEPAAGGLLGALLDSDADGDVDMSDIAQHGIGLLGKLLK
jgi:hypothetical protein